MVPNKEGTWFHKPTAHKVDVYPLDPAGGILCLWGPDVGHTYSFAAETQECWNTDEFQGHIPVHRFDDRPESWEFVCDELGG